MTDRCIKIENPPFLFVMQWGLIKTKPTDNAGERKHTEVTGCNHKSFWSTTPSTFSISSHFNHCTAFLFANNSIPILVGINIWRPFHPIQVLSGPGNPWKLCPPTSSMSTFIYSDYHFKHLLWKKIVSVVLR